MARIFDFFINLKIWLSAFLISISIVEVDLIIKVLFGLPGAVYISFKIYYEFFKNKNKS